MSDNPDRTFRLGDRVRLRVESRKTDHGRIGNVIGTDVWINGRKDNSIFVGWDDGKKTWEKGVELRLAAEV